MSCVLDIADDTMIGKYEVAEEARKNGEVMDGILVRASEVWSNSLEHKSVVLFLLPASVVLSAFAFILRYFSFFFVKFDFFTTECLR